MDVGVILTNRLKSFVQRSMGTFRERKAPIDPGAMVSSPVEKFSQDL